MTALDAASKDSKPLLISDLNSDLDFPRGRQEEILLADLGDQGLQCVRRDFRPRRTRQMRGCWTWRQLRTLQSGCDTVDVFYRGITTRTIARWLCRSGRGLRGGAAICKGEKDAPCHPLPPLRPMLKEDTMFEELVDAVDMPQKRDRPAHDWIRGGA